MWAQNLFNVEKYFEMTIDLIINNQPHEFAKEIKINHYLIDQRKRKGKEQKL